MGRFFACAKCGEVFDRRTKSEHRCGTDHKAESAELEGKKLHDLYRHSTKLIK